MSEFSLSSHEIRHTLSYLRSKHSKLVNPRPWDFANFVDCKKSLRMPTKRLQTIAQPKPERVIGKFSFENLSVEHYRYAIETLLVGFTSELFKGFDIAAHWADFSERALTWQSLVR